jgi:uncharacterized protein YcgI (DUF1989 family)
VLKSSRLKQGKSMGNLQTIPARRGKAARVNKGQSIKVINTHGNQVVDTWAFNAGDFREYMGMEHCRALWSRLYTVVGVAMITNRRRPILTHVEDISPGRHDTLIAPCDNERYGLLGCTAYHDNCRDNLHGGLAELGITIPYTPPSLNTFMNIPWRQDGGLEWGNCLCKKGDYVVFRAEMDAIVAFSACPQDLLPINNGITTEAHFEVIG